MTVFYRQHLLLPTLLFVLGAFIFASGQLDFIVGDYFYNGIEFSGKSSLWADTLIHKGGGKLIFTIAVGALAFLVVSLKLNPLKPYRPAAWYVLACIALGTGLVNGLKALTNVDCPWDLTRYGGLQPYISLFADKPDWLKAGRCFPGGHSSGAFSLFGLYFLARRYRPDWARVTLLGVTMLGILFAVGQWARGAHFPSHDFYSAYLCWLVALLLDYAFWHSKTQPAPKIESEPPFTTARLPNDT